MEPHPDPLASAIVNVDALPASTLEDLRRLSFERSCEDNAPKFARWMHAWVDAVQAAQARGESVGPYVVEGKIEIGNPELAAAVPMFELAGIPPIQGWSNREVADGLHVSGALAHSANEFTLGQLADRLQAFFAVHARIRLYDLPPAKEQ